MNTSTQLSYNEYIQSDAWKQRKEDFFAAHNKECSACGSTQALDLHHKTYARLGSEVDNDLIALCETCHAEYHAIFRHPSVTDSENFVAVKHASFEGKELFKKYKTFVDKQLSEPMREYESRMVQLRTTVNAPAFEVMSVKQKDEIRLYANEIGNLFNDFATNCYMSILEMENPHIGTRTKGAFMVGYLDIDGKQDPSSESNRKDLHLQLKYRWLQQEIMSLTPYEATRSELQKIKMVLIKDDINQSVIASGYRKKETGFWAWLLNP